MANVDKKSSSNFENKKKSFQNLNSRWSNKFNLDEMYDINPEEIKEQQKNEQQLKKEELKNKKNSDNEFINKELEIVMQKCKSPKYIGKNIGEGAVAGGSFVLPTFGYGSMLVIQSNNRDTLYRLKKSFYDKPFKTWGWNLLSILPMLLMWLFTFIIAYVVFASVAQVNYGPIFYFLGIGVNISCIPLVLLLKENSIPYSIRTIDDMKLNDSKWKWSIGIGVTMFALMIAFGLIIRFAWNTGSNENLLRVNGFSTLSNSALIAMNAVNAELSIESIKALANTQQIIILLIGGIFSGFFALIPGLSSGFGFALMGDYRLINEALYAGFMNKTIGSQNGGVLFTTNEAWPIIIVAAIGYIVGFIASLYLIGYLLNKNERFFNSLSIWLLVGSIFTSFIALSKHDYIYLGQNSIVLGVSLLMLFLGMLACVPKLTIYFLRKKKNNEINLN